MARNAPLQIVTFRVDGRSFGIDVGAIREIKGWQQTTPLPNAASHVLGVINLRGAIIAVYDLRRRLGIGATELCRSSVVLVADIGDRQIGILADAVSDIVDVPESALRAAPPLSSGGDDSCVGWLCAAMRSSPCWTSGLVIEFRQAA